MDRRTLLWIVALVGLVPALPAFAAPQARDVKAFHRAGQTFITFGELDVPPAQLTWG